MGQLGHAPHGRATHWDTLGMHPPGHAPPQACPLGYAHTPPPGACNPRDRPVHAHTPPPQACTLPKKPGDAPPRVDTPGASPPHPGQTPPLRAHHAGVNAKAAAGSLPAAAPRRPIRRGSHFDWQLFGQWKGGTGWRRGSLRRLVPRALPPGSCGPRRCPEVAGSSPGRAPAAVARIYS